MYQNLLKFLRKSRIFNAIPLNIVQWLVFPNALKHFRKRTMLLKSNQLVQNMTKDLCFFSQLANFLFNSSATARLGLFTFDTLQPFMIRAYSTECNLLTCRFKSGLWVRTNTPLVWSSLSLYISFTITILHNDRRSLG